jgi:hypothetical protein
LNYQKCIRLFPDSRHEGEEAEDDTEEGPGDVEKTFLLAATPVLSDANQDDGHGQESSVEEGENEALDDEKAERQKEDQVFTAGF